VHKDDAILLKEGAFVNLALNEVMSDEPFAEFFEPIIASLLEAVETFF
jgi:hypothetical protein